MDLPLDGREFARWTVSGVTLPTDPPQVAIDDGDWVDTAWAAVADATGSKPKREFRLLVAGPAAVLGDAVLLAAGAHTTAVKIEDNPEIIVRDTDEITVG